MKKEWLNLKKKKKITLYQITDPRNSKIFQAGLILKNIHPDTSYSTCWKVKIIKKILKWSQKKDTIQRNKIKNYRGLLRNHTTQNTMDTCLKH